MTPDLQLAGAEALQRWREKEQSAGASGGRSAGYGRPVTRREPDFAHGVALYLDDITVSFDGFKAAWRSTSASCAASSAPTARARRP
jgi:urea transport system ATP-binding protein